MRAKRAQPKRKRIIIIVMILEKIKEQRGYFTEKILNGMSTERIFFKVLSITRFSPYFFTLFQFIVFLQ